MTLIRFIICLIHFILEMQELFDFIRWEKVAYFASCWQLWILTTIVIIIILHLLQFLTSVEYFFLLGSVWEEFSCVEFRIFESYLVLKVSMVGRLYIFMSKFVMEHLGHITSSNFHSNSFFIIMILTRWTAMGKGCQILFIWVECFPIYSNSWCHGTSRQTFLLVSPLFSTTLHLIFPLSIFLSILSVVWTFSQISINTNSLVVIILLPDYLLCIKCIVI